MMGEYEDRYPDSYGRGEDIAQPAAADTTTAAPPRPVRGARSLDDRSLYEAKAFAHQPELASHWQHAPRQPTHAVGLAAPRVRGVADTFRGLGPRGYARPTQRIYEDICDRLMENPFVDASDIEVAVTAGEVTLLGSVDNPIAVRQAETIAAEVVGVRHVHNHLTVRPSGAYEGTPGDQVNRAMGSTSRFR
jgi:hypothetical protein